MLNFFSLLFPDIDNNFEGHISDALLHLITRRDYTG